MTGKQLAQVVGADRLLCDWQHFLVHDGRTERATRWTLDLAGGHAVAFQHVHLLLPGEHSVWVLQVAQVDQARLVEDAFALFPRIICTYQMNGLIVNLGLRF